MNILVFLIFILTACNEEHTMNTKFESIGVAKMSEDGTVSIQLRAESDTAIGDGLFEYKPDSPGYDEIIEHLGGIEPGQEKPVPPWPDDE